MKSISIALAVSLFSVLPWHGNTRDGETNVVLTGDIMTMPGLPKVPSAEKIDVSDDGVISGLF